jgi:hypothetical protein
MLLVDFKLRLFSVGNPAHWTHQRTIPTPGVGWAVLDCVLGRDDNLVAYSGWSSGIQLLVSPQLNMNLKPTKFTASHQTVAGYGTAGLLARFSLEPASRHFLFAP